MKADRRRWAPIRFPIFLFICSGCPIGVSLLRYRSSASIRFSIACNAVYASFWQQAHCKSFSSTTEKKKKSKSRYISISWWISNEMNLRCIMQGSMCHIFFHVCWIERPSSPLYSKPTDIEIWRCHVETSCFVVSLTLIAQTAISPLFLSSFCFLFEFFLLCVVDDCTRKHWNRRACQDYLYLPALSSHCEMHAFPRV